MNIPAVLAPLELHQGARRTVACTGVLFICVIVAAAVYDIVRSYHQAVENTGRELGAQARTIAEQTARSIQAVDVVLRHLAQQFHQGTLAALSAEDLRAHLKEQAVGLVQIDGLLVTHADGSLRGTSYLEPTTESQVKLSAHAFQVARSGQHKGLFIDIARISTVDKRWIFPMQRRIESPAGEFAGMVAARGRIDYYQQFFQDIALDPGTNVTLIHQNGEVVARYPVVEAALGKRFAVFDELLASHRTGDSAPMRAISPIDGVDRYGTFRLVPDYPLAIVVARDTRVALAPWRQQALGSIVRTLSLGGLAALLLMMAVRQLHRLDGARASLEESRERYALAVAGSDDGIWDWNYASGVCFASARAREILGLPPGPELQPIKAWLEELEPRLHPGDGVRRQAAIDAHLAGTTSAYECEYRVMAHDGSYRWVRSRGMSVRRGTGKPHRMAGSITDIDAQRSAEDALRESEERFSLAVAGSNDGILDWDIVHDRMFASQRAMKIAGIQAEDTVRTRAEWVALLKIHPDDQQRHAEDFRRHLDGESEVREGEYRVRHPDGEYRWVRVRGMSVRDITGKAVRWAGSVSDIDARKRTEEALRLSEDRFALAVAGSNDGILDWDIVHDRMFTSKRAMEIAGVEAEGTMRTCAEWVALLQIHPDDQLRLAEDFRWLVDGEGEVREGEYRLRHPDGQYHWIRVRGMCVRNTAGKSVRWAGSVSDVDARKRAEEALRLSEERFALAVAGSNDGIVDWDVEHDRMYSSDRAMQILGVESGVNVRTRAQWSALIQYHPDDVQRMKDDLQSFLDGHTELRDGEYRVLLPSGKYRWIRHRNKCVRDKNGRPIRVAGSVSDIDAYKRVEGQLLQAKKLEAIGTLAGGIAHDFNNILAAILGYGEMAQKDAPAGTPLRRHVDAVVNAGMRAKSLVERILAFSRSGIGERVPIHVQSVVGEALDLVAAALPNHVRLVRKLDAGDAAVMGDPTQIHQVVMNLCANAAQAMKADGTLTVALVVVEKNASVVATSALAGGRYVKLSVRDTGSGIPAQVLERVFDPFFTTKEVGVGTGLGLSLVHGIVTDLDGGIDVDSAVGEGTTFAVYLPWTATAAMPKASSEAVPLGSGETVMLVDDEEMLVRLSEEMVARLGYEPVGFTSSAAALKTLRETPQRFHAVLSDESMPDMTGSELADEIRKLRPDLPIVLMSGFVSPALLSRAKALGITDVLAKPLAERDIARSLANALGNGG